MTYSFNLRGPITGSNPNRVNGVAVRVAFRLGWTAGLRLKKVIFGRCKRSFFHNSCALMGVWVRHFFIRPTL